MFTQKNFLKYTLIILLVISYSMTSLNYTLINHFWILRKLHCPKKYPIQVLHKHCQYISHYHKHFSAYSVQQAIKLLLTTILIY